MENECDCERDIQSHNAHGTHHSWLCISRSHAHNVLHSSFLVHFPCGFSLKRDTARSPGRSYYAATCRAIGKIGFSLLAFICTDLTFFCFFSIHRISDGVLHPKRESISQQQGGEFSFHTTDHLREGDSH